MEEEFRGWNYDQYNEEDIIQSGDGRAFLKNTR